MAWAILDTEQSQTLFQPLNLLTGLTSTELTSPAQANLDLCLLLLPHAVKVMPCMLTPPLEYRVDSSQRG